MCIRDRSSSSRMMIIRPSRISSSASSMVAKPCTGGRLTRFFPPAFRICPGISALLPCQRPDVLAQNVCFEIHELARFQIAQVGPLQGMGNQRDVEMTRCLPAAATHRSNRETDAVDGDGSLLDHQPCLLYTSDAADERSSVDLGGRR